MGGATVGQWGQLAHTELWLWGQSYVFASTEIRRARSEQYTYSKMTTARSNDLALFGCSCYPVERAPGLSNGSKPSFSPISSSYTIVRETSLC